MTKDQILNSFSGAAACAAVVLAGGLIVTAANSAAAGNGQLDGSFLYGGIAEKYHQALTGQLFSQKITLVHKNSDFDFRAAIQEKREMIGAVRWSNYHNVLASFGDGVELIEGYAHLVDATHI